jgi:rSAM/selenodomain-associated transferase 1
MSEDQLILVFSKPAVPGAVKTRLVPPFTPEEAAEFHLASLADVVAVAERVAGERVELHVAGDADDVAEFGALYPDHAVRRQGEGELGARLAHAFDVAFQAGWRRVLIVGSDHPTLPPEFLSACFAHLDHADLALGPTQDGGYYCVALRGAAWPAARGVFHRIPWSTPRVLELTLEQARLAGFAVALAPEWYDVDRPEDLQLVGRDAPPDSAALRYLKTLWRRSGGCCSS